jgi:hypothetical protein
VLTRAVLGFSRVMAAEAGQDGLEERERVNDAL